MGLGGISIWQLVIILVIVLLLFGTKRLRNLGGDLGGAIKGFKKAITDEDSAKDPGELNPDEQNPDEQKRDNHEHDGLAGKAQKSAKNDNEKS